MREEDRSQGFINWSGMRAEDVDLGRFHRVWVLGLLLGLEGTALRRDEDAIISLKRIAEINQEADGSFYPARVPWLTARVVWGLCRCGDNYYSSATVKRACDWLRTSTPDGPYSFGAWASGTGTWNSELMTTAMCVSALGQAGVPIHDSVLRASVAYLRSRKSEWAQPGGEIETAAALEAFLLVGGRWREVGKELSQLLKWARDRSLWLEASKLASDSHTESGKVPFVATELVAIVWATVKRELPLLFEGLGIYSWTTSQFPKQADSGLEIAMDVRERMGAALIELQEVATQNVRDRQQIIRSGARDSPTIRGQMELWRERQLRTSELRSELRSIHDRSRVNAFVSKLNQHGRDILGQAWRDIGDS
jgi:hypothetical protein